MFEQAPTGRRVGQAQRGANGLWFGFARDALGELVRRPSATLGNAFARGCVELLFSPGRNVPRELSVARFIRGDALVSKPQHEAARVLGLMHPQEAAPSLGNAALERVLERDRLQVTIGATRTERAVTWPPYRSAKR